MKINYSIQNQHFRVLWHVDSAAYHSEYDLLQYIFDHISKCWVFARTVTSEIKIFTNFSCLFPKLWFFFNVRYFELFKYLIFALGLALVLADCFPLMNSPSAHTSAILSVFCGAWLLRNDLDPFCFYQAGKKLSSSLKSRFGMQKMSVVSTTFS